MLTRFDASNPNAFIVFVRRDYHLGYLGHVTQVAQQVFLLTSNGPKGVLLVWSPDLLFSSIPESLAPVLCCRLWRHVTV